MNKENECKYCKKHAWKTDEFGDNAIQIVDDGATAYILFERDYGKFPIKYCPFCGRRVQK